MVGLLLGDGVTVTLQAAQGCVQVGRTAAGANPGWLADTGIYIYIYIYIGIAE